MPRRTLKDRLSGSAGYIFSRQRSPDTGDDDTTADNWSLAGKYDYFFSEDVPQKTIEEMIAFNEQVGLEDNGLVESVHAGLESGMVEHGRLLPTSEHLIQHFQRLIYSYLS